MADKKRFIAGASCPQCREQDSVMLYHEGHDEVMECVACGYRQVQGEQASPEPAQTGEVIGLFKP